MVFKEAATPQQLAAISELGFVVQPSIKLCKLVRWIPPLQGFLLNVDGASKGNPNPCGGGGIVRNAIGSVVLGFSHFYGNGNNLLAEARVIWIPPLQGFLLNVDGASKGNPSPCGGGGIVRNAIGSVVLGFSHFYGNGNNLLAEARVMCDGVQLAVERGILVDQICSDSTILVNSLRTGIAPSWTCYRWWRFVLDFVQQNRVRVYHVYSEANQVADALATFACTARCNVVFSSSIQLPRPCFPALVGDRLGLGKLRVG
ncbi:hypothetical protein Taro_056372, partial [Colocasia esculenta]|nr:hypothetical protein [Colocasia esculenta]